MVLRALASPYMTALIVGLQPSSPMLFSCPSSWHACHRHSAYAGPLTNERLVQRQYSRCRSGKSAASAASRP